MISVIVKFNGMVMIWHLNIAMLIRIDELYKHKAKTIYEDSKIFLGWQGMAFVELISENQSDKINMNVKKIYGASYEIITNYMLKMISI